jgi:hypothetical protein
MTNKKIKKTTDQPPELEVERLERVIGELPTIPPRARTDTKRYLIERLREPLRQAMTQRGYSFAGLAAILTQAGLTVHASTLRQYLGPIHPRRVAPRSDQPPTDKPATGEPSPARAGRETAPSARPRAGAVGSPEALARLESAWAGTPSGPPPAQAAAPAARPRSDDPPYCPPGTFVPRPDLPIEEWYKPSGRTS